MKQFLFLVFALVISAKGADVNASANLPPTLMTLRGKLLASEDFAGPLAPLVGKPVGFASGFTGWRFTANAAGGKSGFWEVRDGMFRGTESPDAHHPATASFGIQFKDAIIQCEVRMEDVPAEGRQYRSFFVKATDAKDYVCALFGSPGGMNALAYDDEHRDPKSGQRAKFPAVAAPMNAKLGEWHTAVLEIKGEELVATLDGRSVTLSSPLVGAEKHSVMLGVGTVASFRNFRMWEALPNPDWPKHRAELQKASAPKAKPQATVEQTFRSEKLAEIDATMEQAIRDEKIVGAAVWVERNGAAYHQAYGQRSLAGAPMTEDTIFDVASITKVVAAATAAMQCAERKMIALDDPVAKFIPEFTGDGREKITIRHLLLHTSGLPTNVDLRGQPITSLDEAIAWTCRQKPGFEPGSAFNYSSVGTMVLGVVIERATGRKFDEFCTTEIFRPLRMNDTGFRPTGPRLDRVAPTREAQGGIVDDEVARAVAGVAGHASLFTTTADLARFARTMLNLGELDGVRILQPETVKMMTSVQSPADLRSPGAANLPVRRALGWDIDSPYRTPPHDYSLHRGALFPVGSFGHAGWTGQALWIDPFSRTFVIFLCNRYGKQPAAAPSDTYRLHHRVSTLAAEAVKGFDFANVPGALPRANAQP